MTIQGNTKTFATPGSVVNIYVHFCIKVGVFYIACICIGHSHNCSVSAFEKSSIQPLTTNHIFDTVTILQWKGLDRVIIFQQMDFKQNSDFQAEIKLFQAWDKVQYNPEPVLHHICWNSLRWENPFKKQKNLQKLQTCAKRARRWWCE